MQNQGADIYILGFNLNLPLLHGLSVMSLMILMTVWAWEALYKYIIDQHIPLRKAKVRSNSLPWMTSS